MKIKIFVLTFSFFLLVCFAYNYTYQSHRDILSEKPFASFSSDNLMNEFLHKKNTAQTRYINQVISVKGVISSISKDIIILNPGITCKKDTSFVFSKKSVGDDVIIKGRCIGFDELFGEVKLDQCSLIDYQ